VAIGAAALAEAVEAAGAAVLRTALEEDQCADVCAVLETVAASANAHVALAGLNALRLLVEGRPEVASRFALGAGVGRLGDMRGDVRAAARALLLALALAPSEGAASSTAEALAQAVASRNWRTREAALLTLGDVVELVPPTTSGTS